MTAMIKVHALQKYFIMHNQGGIRLPVFSDVAFDVSAGEALILHGESGVGKTSLLRILYGNYKPSSGHVLVRHGEDYIDLATATPRAILTVRRKTIRYVSQFLRVIPRVTTLDIVKDPLLARGIDDADLAFDHIPALPNHAVLGGVEGGGTFRRILVIGDHAGGRLGPAIENVFEGETRRLFGCGRLSGAACGGWIRFWNPLA